MKLTRLETLIIALIVVVAVGSFVVTRALAEQHPGSPKANATSILKDTYNELEVLEYGSEVGSNGAMWNRIISSALWVPDGTVTQADVASGKTYYDESREAKTGSLDFPKYADQSLQAKDFRDNNAQSTWSSWSLTSGTATATTGVYKDNRTGLYWSPRQGTSSNEFNIECDFFKTAKRGDYAGGDSTCGLAINTCANLSLDATGDATPETKWYLPTQAELMQAYLNGIYRGSNTTWATTNDYWSSTESQSNSSFAWYTYLSNGLTHYLTKGTTTLSVRCVLRDLN